MAAAVCRARRKSAWAEADEANAATMTALTCILVARGGWFSVETVENKNTSKMERD